MVAVATTEDELELAASAANCVGSASVLAAVWRAERVETNEVSVVDALLLAVSWVCSAVMGAFSAVTRELMIVVGSNVAPRLRAERMLEVVEAVIVDMGDSRHRPARRAAGLS